MPPGGGGPRGHQWAEAQDATSGRRPRKPPVGRGPGAEAQDATSGRRPRKPPVGRGPGKPPGGGGPGSHQWAEALGSHQWAEARDATRGRRPGMPPGGGGPGSQVAEAVGGQWERRGQYGAEFEMLVFTCVTGGGGGLGSVPPPESIASLSLETFTGAAAGTETEPAGGRGGAKDGGAVPPSMTRPEAEPVVMQPFVLSEALPVVPAKLAHRIRKGEYVEMAELLKDNVEAERRRLAAGESGTARVSRREVPDFESWLQCFSSYAAIVATQYPHKARELWAYQALMIAEHRKCGGRGWLLYDAAFRQQITSLEGTDFSRVNQGLYATTFLAYGGRGQFCARCMSSDHAQEECALHPNREVPVVQLQDSRGRSRREEQVLGEQRRRRGRRGACYAFNDGRCAVPFCRFEHVCSVCGGEHKKSVCRARGYEPRQRNGGEKVTLHREGGQ